MTTRRMDRFTRKRVLLVSISIFMTVFGLILANRLSLDNLDVSCRTIRTICFVFVLMGVGLLTADVARRDMSDYHSFRGIMDQYLAVVGMNFIGYFVKRKIDRTTKSCQETQEEILIAHLKKNMNTEYGLRYSFKSMNSVKDFITKHPLTKYADYEDYVQRIAQGEQNLISTERTKMLAVTSGTSGKSHMIPVIKKRATLFCALIYQRMLRCYPHTNNLLKSLKLFYTPRSRFSEAGIPIGPNSSSPTNSKSMLSLYSTPLAGYSVTTEEEAMYVHLLFALKDRKLGMIEANFASLIYTAFTFLEREWPRLVEDIRIGQIDSELAIQDTTRAQLNSLMKPDPARAAELRREFELGFTGIAQRIWPRCKLLMCVDTGSFHIYGQELQEVYCKDIPIYSALYAATEGLIGINIWPHKERREYLLLPNAMFYEFIPASHSEETQPSTYLMSEVEVGKDYELVITNLSGLYRYRFGDVVRVTRFYNNSPVVEFLYRQGQLLNLRGEKTSEKLFYQNLQETAASWSGVKLMDYCCAENIMVQKAGESAMPHYVVFLELEAENETTRLSHSQKDMLDNNLCKSFVYNSFRKKGSIGPMVVHVVSKDSFKGLRDFMLAVTDASPNQYKVPRVLRRKDAIQFLMDRVSY